MEPGTNIIWLWLPAIVFAHLFAGFWLVKTLLLNDPQALSCCWRRKKQSSKSRHARASQRAARAARAAEREVTAKDIALNLPSGDPSIDMEGGQDPMADGLGEDGMVCAKLANMRVEPLELQWSRIGCSYRAATGTKIVLQDVYGRAAPGEMQALLGPSGAGKSTLMDILAQRKSVGTLTGQLLVSGRPVTRSFIRKTAYVPQEDNFVPTMTTMETMRFYAAIILPDTMGRAGRQQRVEEVLAALGLGTHHKTLVGGVLPGGLMLRGLSGGERKRLSIAAGILAAPSVVFLDEPTSGLDSFAALTVMGYMKRMARTNGQVVIASIHQPRSAIWSMFDTATLLSAGRLMYYGPRDGLVEWFGSRGYHYDPAVHGVASDWALDLVAIGFHKPKKFYGHTITSREQLQSLSASFVARYKESLHGGGKGADGMMDQHSVGSPYGGKRGALRRSSCGGSPGPIVHAHAGMAMGSPTAAGYHGSDLSHNGDEQLEPATAPMWATGWWSQYVACLGRELLAVTRNPADVAGRTLTFSWVALLMGLLYFNMPLNASSLRGRINLLFNGLVFFCLMPYVSMSLYTADKKFYIADASAKLYRAHAYYAAKATATVPFQILSALIFTYTVYGMAGLRMGAEYMLKSGALSSLMYLIAVQVLHCCALLAPNQDVAFMLSILWTTVQLLMSNFFIIFSDLQFKWLVIFKYFSALYYSFEGLSRIEFGDAKFDCSAGVDPSGVTFLKQLMPNSKFLKLNAVTNALTNPGPDCVADTNAMLNYYEFSRPFKITAAILLGYLGATHVLTYTVMVIVARRERR